MPQNTTAKRTHTVPAAQQTPELTGNWDSPAWQNIPAVKIDNFHAKSSDHHPSVQAKLTYDAAGLYIHFRVEDQYIACRETALQANVCRDSCVEFFVQPAGAEGYFNFEINCGGWLLLHYNTIPRHDFKLLDEQVLKQVKIYHSLPERIDPEITEPTTWQVEFFVPYEIFTAECPAVTAPKPGDTWRANLYKCGDSTSHPHWASWSPIGDVLDFHLPEYFGDLTFS